LTVLKKLDLTVNDLLNWSSLEQERWYYDAGLTMQHNSGVKTRKVEMFKTK